MATRDEIKGRIQRRLGFRNDLDNEILDGIYKAQDMLETSQLEAWFLNVETTLSFTAGSQYTAMPTNFIRIPDDGGIWAYDSSLTEPYVKEIKPIGERAARTGYGYAVADAFGDFYTVEEYLDDEYLYIWPWPDVGNTKVNYQAILRRGDSSFSIGNIENYWGRYAPDLIEAYALWYIAQDLRDQELYDKCEQLLIPDARKRFHDLTVAREMADQTNEMGDPD